MSSRALPNVTRGFGGLVDFDNVRSSIPAQGIQRPLSGRGAGKTTLFNVYCGIDARPSAGLSCLPRKILPACRRPYCEAGLIRTSSGAASTNLTVLGMSK